MVLERLKLFGPGTETPRKGFERGLEGDPLTFPQLIEDVCKAWGSKTIFQQKVRRIWQRYSALDIKKRSYELSAGLVALGLKHGDRVAIIAENSVDWVCSYYAIVVAGGVAAPLYYELKPAEIGEMVARSDARMAIVSAKGLVKLRAGNADLDTIVLIGDPPRSEGEVPQSLGRAAGTRLLTIDDVLAAGTTESRRDLVTRDVAPDDIASIVFTSGTTAGMKGVTLTHRNFMANLSSVRRSIPFNEHDRLAMVLPLHHAFPFTVTVAVAPTIGGVVTFENDLRRIRDRMAEVKPTLFIGVPQLFEVMYRNIVHGIETQGRMEQFQKGLRIVEATKQRTGINIGRIVFRELHKRLGGSLRFCVSGGAALNPQVGLNFSRLGVPIIQGWGLTEAAPVLAVQRWNPRKFYMSNYYEERFGTVGEPLEGIEVGLIDVPEKELYVHLHGEGELVARGDNITPGYWKADEDTEVAKVDGWLRTGDVGRIDDEGNIWITGRSKFVIVLDSGEKIHPDEVEEKIERSPLIEDVAVIGRKMRGKAQAWAIVYPNRDEITERLGAEPPSQEAIRALIASEMEAQQRDVASYKRPVDFMLTDIPLPRTMPLRKIARGQIADSYTFDPARWEQTWADHVAATATPSGTSDESDEEPPAAAS